MDWQQQGEALITPEQKRMLNAVCGDLARQLRWHGFRLDKDDWRHLFAGTQLGWRMVPAIDQGDGKIGCIMLGGSSLKLTRSQACEAITQAIAIGDNPAEQGIDSPKVKWSDAVLFGMGLNAADFLDDQ